MPTSKNRSGNSRAKPASPVPSRMPAVSATTRSSLRASSESAAPNSSDHVRGRSPGATGATGETPWYFTGSCSAGAYPLPLRVTTCTTTERGSAFAAASADASAAGSCPSTGPR